MDNTSSARVERATCRLGGDRSIHLSYEDNREKHFKQLDNLWQMQLLWIVNK